MYNLNDAVRKWYVPVFEELERLGCHGYSVDYGVFFWWRDNHLSGPFYCHVEELLWVGSKEFKEKVVFPLCNKFKIKRESVKQIKYVGHNICL